MLENSPVHDRKNPPPLVFEIVTRRLLFCIMSYQRRHYQNIDLGLKFPILAPMSQNLGSRIKISRCLHLTWKKTYFRPPPRKPTTKTYNETLCWVPRLCNHCFLHLLVGNVGVLGQTPTNCMRLCYSSICYSSILQSFADFCRCPNHVRNPL